jgi:soluble lytic murein transglycosylase-like protein
MEFLLNLSTITGVEVPKLRVQRALLEILAAAWVAVKVGAILGSFYLVVLGAKSYHETLPIPMRIVVEKSSTEKLMSPAEIEQARVVKALTYLKCPEAKVKKITEGIIRGAKAIGVKPELILAILFTESRFNMQAVSRKGYKGLMQTPWASKEYADVDILYGARILEEKMHYPQANRNGRLDIRTVLALYKGGLSSEAFKQADEVMRLYSQLLTLKENQG